MTFPSTPLPIEVEISLDGTTWTDITTDVRAQEQIHITRGRSNWAAQTEPGRCQLTLDNNSGKYSPRNPAGPYYGQIGRNTPLRVSVLTGSVALDLPGNTGDYATTPDTGALDITGDIDVRIDATLVNWFQPDYPSSGQTDYPRTELIAKRAAGQISWALYVKSGRPYFEWSTDGTNTGFAWASADLPLTTSGRIALRATLDVDNGSGGFTVNFYTADTINGPWSLLGSGTGTGTTSIFSSTADLRIGDCVETTTGRPALGRVHAAQVYNGIGGTLVASPDFTAQASGSTGFTDSAGRTWSLAGNTQITNRKIRFSGEVASWTPRWDTGGMDVVTDVEAAGVLRRLGVGAVPTKSPFYREFTSSGRMAAGVVSYWPMEDGADATSFASAYDGQPAATFSPSVTPAAYADWVASSPVATISSGSIRATVPAYTLVSPNWGRFGMFVKVPLSGVLSTQRLVSVSQTGTAAVWSVYVNTSGNLALRAYDSTGAQILDTGFGTDSINGLEKYLLLALSTSGSDIAYNLLVVDIAGSLPTAVPNNSFTSFTISGTLTGQTTGRITQVRFGEDAGMNGTAIGHVVVGNTSTTFSASVGVMVGWNAEEGPSRVSRIGIEENLHSYATGSGNEQCGPQPHGTALDIMRSADDVDLGILTELRRVLGIRYVTRASMYNQPAALTLNYQGDDGLVAPLNPTDDDQSTSNDVTVSRTGGSSARATQDTGPLSTQAPPNGIGLYDTSYTVDLLDDTQPWKHANWRLHVGTWDETRYPVVTVNLATGPGSIENASAVDVGSRLQITNPPSWLPPGPIDLRIEGYTETLDQYTWTLAYNCSPFGPWKVAALATVEDFEDSTYQVTITGGGNLPWTLTTAQFHSGTQSLRSGAITDNQTSDAIITVPQGSTEMRFWYRTSSEASGSGFEGDRLLVLVDGTQVLRAQGTTPWTQAIVNVTGAAAVNFRYAKDNSVAFGEDAVYIDDLSFTGRAPCRADTAGSQLAAAATSTATSLVVSTTSGLPWTTDPTNLPINLTIAGETVTATAIASVLTDAFGRTASSSWGTADSGQAWSTSGGTSTDYAVGSGYGSHTLSTVNAVRRSFITFPYADFDYYGSITTSAAATGASITGGLTGRTIDQDNLYTARLEFTTSNAIVLSIRKRVTGTETELGTYTTAITHSPGTFVRLRFQVSGSTLRARVWPVGQTEPAGWQVEVTDTSLTAASLLGARSISLTGNTNTSPQVRYDDLAVINPQTFTVTRSVNGITKAQSSGAAVSLADPAIVAL